MKYYSDAGEMLADANIEGIKAEEVTEEYIEAHCEEYDFNLADFKLAFNKIKKVWRDLI